MPWMTTHPCRYPGCGILLRGKGGYCEAHRNQVRRAQESGRPSASRRGYDSDWRRRRAAYLIDNSVCVRCGDEATEVDHKVPLSAGGDDHPSNYQALCKSCHSVKTGRERAGSGGSNLWQRAQGPAERENSRSRRLG